MGRCRASLLLLLCAVAALANPSCTQHYVASPLEEKWMDWVKERPSDWFRHCDRWEADRSKFDTWIGQAVADRGQPEVDMDKDVFSRHIVNCTGHRSRTLYLEPLAAALRNPRFHCIEPQGHMDTSYLVFPSAANVPHARAYFFDVGSTFYDSGNCGYNDSLAWFVDTFRQKGFNFHRIFLWEMTRIDHTKYWERVPTEAVHRMQFFNTAASDDPQHAMNPLRLMLKVARPEDYVVLKLDIDNNEVEVNLIQQLLHNPKLVALVDELFWENHVHHHPLSDGGGWGDLHRLRGPCSTGLGSYECFRQLRAAGIRAHSWI
eukprot:EG_transcript_17098